jgi:hypothetical protein
MDKVHDHLHGMEVTRRLLFRPHPFNFQRHEVSIPLDEILEARACSALWGVPNGLRLKTAHGKECFAVEGRQSWAERINQALQQML